MTAPAPDGARTPTVAEIALAIAEAEAKFYLDSGAPHANERNHVAAQGVMRLLMERAALVPPGAPRAALARLANAWEECAAYHETITAAAQLSGAAVFRACADELRATLAGAATAKEPR